MRGARAEIVAAARDLLVAASAGLPDPGARWLLSVEELAGLAPPPAGPVLAARERDLARWRAAAIPATPGAAHPGGRVLRGTVASPGRARGPARIVRDPASAPDLAGRILVAEYTDPGWAPLFAAAEAIALQHGNPLSHAAILARELGKPALVGVRDLLATVPEDARVEVDATAGELRLLT
ncbi:MAG: hypothetical protein FJZ01_24005 [Candidatus Sericytochromatia bacterium]|nr:hypothetical protein [Candidatus Tanganyikabacteria bacterium]